MSQEFTFEVTGKIRVIVHGDIQEDLAFDWALLAAANMVTVESRESGTNVPGVTTESMVTDYFEFNIVR